MCGIVGYSGNQEAAPIIFEALRRVEYRGYDSAGIVTYDGKRLVLRKGVGKLDAVETKYNLSQAPGKIGIGHTRWATHGGVTKSNAHPHFDCSQTIAVVHNGTIDNYQELRNDLTKKGHKFISQTDTEVIPHLIEEELKSVGSIKEAILAITEKINGSFTFLVLSSKEPGCIFGYRKESPLVIGMGKNDGYIGSDVLVFPEEIKQFLSLGDNELVILKRNKAQFFNSTGNAITKEAKSFDLQLTSANKNGYPYYMLKEMMEQPQIIEDSLSQNKELFTEIALDILRSDNVVFTACGSSRYAALVGRYLFSRVGRKFCDVVMSSEFQYFTDSVDKNTLVIAVSQSGETADVIDGIKKARAGGAKVVSIINRPMSLLSDLSDHVIYLNCGPEIGVAATKSFTTQLIIFYLLAFSMVNCFDIAIKTLKKIKEDVSETIQWNNRKIKNLCEKLKDRRDFYYIARGINFAIASEGALKLKEISYIHAEGMPAGELKHGTIALIEEGTPILIVCPDDYTYSETINNAIEAKSRGGYIIAVSDRDNEIYDSWIKIPKVDELLYPLVTVIPLQLLAYYMALVLGYDPDKPRNLAKSVTVK